MRIAMIEEDLSPRSGSRRLIYYSTNHLQALGHKVKIFAKTLNVRTCFPNMLSLPVEVVPEREAPTSSFLRKISGRNIGFYWSYAQGAMEISRRVADWKPDVVIFHYTGEYWLPPYFYHIENPIGVVCFHVIPRGIPPYPRLSLNGKIGQAIFNMPPIRKWNAISQKKIGMTITHSKFVEEHVSKIHSMKAKIMRTIPLGVDHEEFYPTGEEEPFALYLGRIHPQKGLELVVQAMEKSNPDFSLVIAGDLTSDLMWYKEKLLDLAGEMHLSDRVRIVEAPTSTQVVRLMQRCAVFLFPSTVDTFGLVVLEAMACGKPIIACRAGGVPELLDGCGFLLDPIPTQWHEALGKLLTDSRLRKHVGEKALERSMMYSWEKTTNTLLSALHDFVAQRQKVSKA